MSRGFHEACNTTLRTAMADLFDFGDGWTLLGCFADGQSLVWRPLTSIAEAISEPLHQAADDAGVDRLFGPVLTSGFAEAPPEELRHLRGIAEVHYSSDEQGRTGHARAVFDDAWRHTVTWRSAEAAPAWALISPPEVAASALADDRVLPELFTAMLQKQGVGHRCVSDEQREASTRLRDLLGELVAAGLHTVFVIFRSDQGWEAIPVNDLAARVGAKVAAGMSVVNAVGELAAEVEADPPAVIPTLRGVGTIVHYDNDDGSSHASLVAVCDQTLHAAAWIHGQDRPDWQILPVAAADPDYWLMSLAYTQLTEAIRGTSR